jgi:phage shock protein C
MELKKSKNRIFAGVAGGIAEYQKMKPSFVRLIWILVFIFSAGLAVLAYILMAFIMAPPSNFDLNDFRQQ